MDGMVKPFGFLRASLTVACVMALQFVFLLILGAAEYRGVGTAQLKVEGMHVYVMGQGLSGTPVYGVSFDVVQSGSGMVGRAKAVVDTEAGSAVFDVVLSGKVTHCVEYIGSRPDRVNVTMVPGSFVRPAGLYSYFNTTNVMLTGSFATLLVTAFAVLSRGGYGVLFPLRTVPVSIYVASVMLLGGYQIVRVSLVVLLSFLAPPLPVDPSGADVIKFFQSAAEENMAIFFACSVIVAPVLEEFLFRGFILGRMLGTKRPFVSIAVSSVLFGIVHSGANQIVGAGFLGLVCGYVFYRTGSVFPCIAVHFLNNLLAFANVVSLGSSGYVQAVVPSSSVVSGMTFAFGGVLLYRGALSLSLFSEKSASSVQWLRREGHSSGEREAADGDVEKG